ncbi:DUF3194 domain-containing protein [Halogeometricum borinquense]|uniref:DUF3194 domain-containing protein n=2 Tax=Halogeometricum borinquense TaxID=60847 RepID=E4NSM0_HALBP|nr:DUF3194 domain-containing protein [Halogeometricum borinquense]ADQ68113.1 Protein of unknown function (DUF3194) [Halogeometricum borinquense DSM 11551]ELY24843.1 hypothetical protein C499_15635 [Halogeometricum borinquense DSM 11551]QIB73291.1 DUF3194 domain-containing protein [Halogeometricum borinquense]QIQ77311.1 DUF3194 domain-containing protein [Halogeometricum borinquense]
MPTDETVVETAAEAAEGVIFARYKQSDVKDFDVTVTFEDGILDVDVYINAPDDADADADDVADEAARTAQDAVDELFAESDADSDANAA